AVERAARQRDHRQYRGERGQHDRAEAAHRGVDDRVPAVVAGGDVLLDLVHQITELRITMPASAIVPSRATKPNGMRNSSRNQVAPIRPSGAVTSTISVREKLRSCTISRVVTTNRNSGMPALIEFWPRAESSTEPPTSSR